MAVRCDGAAIGADLSPGLLAEPVDPERTQNETAVDFASYLSECNEVAIFRGTPQYRFVQ